MMMKFLLLDDVTSTIWLPLMEGDCGGGVSSPFITPIPIIISVNSSVFILLQKYVIFSEDFLFQQVKNASFFKDDLNFCLKLWLGLEADE